MLSLQAMAETTGSINVASSGLGLRHWQTWYLEEQSVDSEEKSTQTVPSGAVASQN